MVDVCSCVLCCLCYHRLRKVYGPKRLEILVTNTATTTNFTRLALTYCVSY